MQAMRGWHTAENACACHNRCTQRPLELQGVCTSWLAALRPGEDRVPVWIQAGVLRLPADPAVPLLLVGPGTGVAPFRSFVEDRQADIAAGQRT